MNTNNRMTRFMAVLVMACVAGVCVASDGWAVDEGWPREIKRGGNTLRYYQPQLDSWEKQAVLKARAAVVLTLEGQQKPLAGALWFKADTATGLDSRTVLLNNLTIERVSFSLVDQSLAASAEQGVNSMVPRGPITVSLDRVLAGLKQTQAAAQSIPLKNDPPPIYVSSSPARLVIFDSEPALAPVAGTNLQYVVNTNWTIFNVMATSSYYLLDGKTWLTANALTGPWQVATSLPAELRKLPSDDNFKDARENMPPGKPQYSKPPQFYVTTVPAELIVISGKPQLERIGSSGLQYVKNTDVDLFYSKGDANWYYLVAGRWYRAAALDGPWSFATADLPQAFAELPTGSPKARVLYAVPGTPQAQEATLVANIPQTATVKISEAKLNVVYTGNPVFVPIEGTSLYHAANASATIIKVSEASYYACERGVWFVASSPAGPWVVATTVPQVIYTIPPSAPVYNVTYVTQTQTSTDEVAAAFTIGFLGGFITGGVLAWGTGYYYPPYWYPAAVPIYRPYPYTYGASAWYNPATNTYYRGGAAYGPHGGYKVGQAYNPTTGAWAQGAAGYGPNGAWRAGQAYNPSTGTRAAGVQGSNMYGSWGRGVVTRGDEWARGGYRSTSAGTVAGVQTSRGTGAIGVETASGRQGFAAKGQNNTYVGNDGNVYRKSDSGWEKYNDGNWSNVDTSQAQAKAEQQTQARSQQGQERSQQAQTRVQQGQTAGGTESTPSQTRTQAQQQAQQGRSQQAQTAGAMGTDAMDHSTLDSLNRENANRQIGEQRTQSWNRDFQPQSRQAGGRSEGMSSRGGFGQAGGGGGGRSFGGGRRR